MHIGLRNASVLRYYRPVAVVTALALVVWVSGFPGLLRHADAAQLTHVTDTLSTSKPGVGANHTISFITPTGVPADGSTIVVTMPSGFSLGALSENDVDVQDNGTDLVTDTSCSGGVDASVTPSGQNITIAICSGGGGAIGAGDTVTVKIGTNATQSGTGSVQVTNDSTSGSYTLSVGGTMADTGDTQIVVIDSVTVSGSVDTFLAFSVSGVGANQAVGGSFTFGTTTATSVAYGNIVPGDQDILAQDLSATSNAKYGFTVTVGASSDLQSSNGATIDAFVDGSATATPIAWAAPSAQLGNDHTYGHWGVTTNDATLSDGNSFNSGNFYAGNFIGTQREVMYSTSTSDGSTQNIGKVRVAYKVQISTMQEAAKDYTTTLTYIVTPAF